MKGLLKNWKREKGKILFYAAVAFLPLIFLHGISGIPWNFSHDFGLVYTKNVRFHISTTQGNCLMELYYQE